MEHTINLIKKFFENNEWEYDFEDDTFAVELELGGSINSLSYIVYVDKTDFIVFGRLPITPSKQALPRVAEYLHRVNCFMPYGNFEIDYDTNMIHYKVYVNFEYCNLSYAVVERSLQAPYAMVNVFGENLLKAMYSTESVEKLANQARG